MAKNLKETILVVDDKAENITIIYGILKDLYNVKVANNGEKALKLAEAPDKPDLVLLDIMMPGMDGYEVCAHLKKNAKTSNIPVIFVTSKDQAVEESKGLELGAVDYITKPISPSILLARLKTHLALYNQNRALDLKVKERTQELEETRFEIIRKLGVASEYKDNETGLHVLRMSKYSKEIALAYGLNEQASDLLLNAAPMHDVGKIGIPDKVLLKPGKLDSEEWNIMKSHTNIGADIIKNNNKSELLKAAYASALTHHERWDGTGYPKGLKKDQIPLFGRILAIADVFDALTSERPYKSAWTNKDATDLILKEKSTHFDPDVVDAFFKAYPKIEEIQTKYKE